MTFIVGLFGLALGLVLGSLLGSRHAEELHSENDAFRVAIRHARGMVARHPELRGLARYLDRALDDEAGA